MPELTNGTVAKDPKLEVTQDQVLSSLVKLSSSEEFKVDSIQRAVAIMGQLNARSAFEWTTTKLKEVQSALQEALGELEGSKKNKKAGDEAADIIAQAIQGEIDIIARELNSREVLQFTASGEQIRGSKNFWYDISNYDPKQDFQVSLKRVDGITYIFSSPPTEINEGQILLKGNIGTYIRDSEGKKDILYVNVEKSTHVEDILRSGYVQIGDRQLFGGKEAAVDSNKLEKSVLIDALRGLTDNSDMQQFLSFCINQSVFLHAPSNTIIANLANLADFDNQYVMSHQETDFIEPLIIKKNDDGSISIRYVFAYSRITQTMPDFVSIISEDGKPLMTIDTTYIIRPKVGGGVVLEVGQCTHNIHDKRLLSKQLNGTKDDGTESIFINPFYELISKSHKRKTVLEQWVQPATGALDLRLETLEKGKTIFAVLKERERNIKEAIANLSTQLNDVSVNKKLEYLVDIVAEISGLHISLESLLKDGNDLLGHVSQKLESSGEQKQEFEELKSAVETYVKTFEAEKKSLDYELQELKSRCEGLLLFVPLSVEQLLKEQAQSLEKAKIISELTASIIEQTNTDSASENPTDAIKLIEDIVKQIDGLSASFVTLVEEDGKTLQNIKRLLSGELKPESAELRTKLVKCEEELNRNKESFAQELLNLRSERLVLSAKRLVEKQKWILLELGVEKFRKENQRFLNISSRYEKSIKLKQLEIRDFIAALQQPEITAFFATLAESKTEAKDKKAKDTVIANYQDKFQSSLKELLGIIRTQQEVLQDAKNIKIPGGIGHFFSWLFRPLTRLFTKLFGSKAKVDDAQQAKVVEDKVNAYSQQPPQPSLSPKPASEEPSKGPSSSGLDKAQQRVRSDVHTTMALVATAGSVAAFAVNPSSLGVAAVVAAGVAAGVAAVGAVAATMKTKDSENAAAVSTTVIMEKVNGSDSDVTKLVEERKLSAGEAKSVNVKEQAGGQGDVTKDSDDKTEQQFHLSDFPRF